MAGSEVYRGVTADRALEIVQAKYPDKKIITKYYCDDNLMLYFIEEPDKYFSNHIAERGQAALVVW